MKALFRNVVLAISGLLTVAHIYSQEVLIDSTGLPGDHFSLEGALDLFKHSESLEDFEKELNMEGNTVNNLDLNDDGEVDYIRVEDQMEDDVHAIILQVPVSKTELQDIAVIEIEKTGATEAVLQIVGDEDIYGEHKIVEPYESEDMGRGPSLAGGLRLVVNVWLWPSVRYVYRPGYRAWVSPWYWRHYPTWWRPWRPRPYSWFRVHRPVLHRHYHVAHTHRVVMAHSVYTPRRKTSVTVVNKHQRSLQTYRTTRGVKRTTRTTVVNGSEGGKAVVRKTNTTVAGKNSKGEAAANRKTTTVVGKTADGKKVGARKSESKSVGKTRDGKTVRKQTTDKRLRSGDKKAASRTTKKSVRKSPRKKH